MSAVQHGPDRSPPRQVASRASPEIAEPLDELCRVVLVELDVREEGLEHRGAGVAGPEEHQLGLPQVHRCQRGGEVGPQREAGPRCGSGT